MFIRLLIFAALCGGARAEIQLQEKVERLAVPHQGPFVRTGDGAIWGIDVHGAIVSRDEGRTWQPRAIFDEARFQSRPERALLRTKEGVLLHAFLNDRERVFRWDDARGGPQPDCQLPVYVVRSSDDGRTWTAPFQLQDGWCGAVRQMIQMRTGRIVLVAQKAVPNPGRHVTITYYSDDLGLSWKKGGTIDHGAAGNYTGRVVGIPGSTHGGAIEGTVLEKANGELKLLLRVPHGHFEEATSKDGVDWSPTMPAPVEASDSPGMMVRLASGRVVLVWNRWVDPVQRRGRREELSVAFSANDGQTWTVPQVVAVNRGPAGANESRHWIAYPYVFEPSPGRLWISTMQGELRVALNETDFLAPLERPLDGSAVRIVLLGDSITKGARPGVSPTQTFGALVQAALREEGLAARVHNVAIGGERTDLALLRLERDVISQRPDVVTVMYGTNDSWVDQGAKASRLDEAAFAANLRLLVQRLEAARIKVVLMTAPAFEPNNPRNGLQEDPNERLGQYMTVTRAVARDLGVPLVDHFFGWKSVEVAGRGPNGWTTDGCHPNATGHADLAKRIMPPLLQIVRALTLNRGPESR